MYMVQVGGMYNVNTYMYLVTAVVCTCIYGWPMNYNLRTVMYLAVILFFWLDTYVYQRVSGHKNRMFILKTSENFSLKCRDGSAKKHRNKVHKYM